ncbi:MAG: TRAP transporter small permease [Kiritimatiellaeota bacterium]|nr:TRAP transporter small permease [Kiritimatiellota bacterium]
MGVYRLVRGGAIRLLEWALVAMVVAITLNVLWGIVTRTFWGQAIYTDELARVLLVWISMLGGALAFERKAHLGVDFFVSKMHPDARKALAILVQCVTAVFAAVVLVVGGTALAQGQWAQRLPTMPWLTKGGVYAAIPIAGFFILLFSLENLAAIIRTPAERVGAQTQSEG